MSLTALIDACDRHARPERRDEPGTGDARDRARRRPGASTAAAGVARRRRQLRSAPRCRRVSIQNLERSPDDADAVVASMIAMMTAND